MSPPTDPARMHRYDDGSAELARAVFGYVADRTRREVPLDGPRPAVELEAAVGGSVTAGGLGWEEALRRFTEVLAPATISMDHPLHLAYVPAAPTEAAVLFDLVVSASSIFGGSWQEGAGAVFAENQALAWLAGLCGLPDDAGGCFVSGGSAANLSALVAARHAAASARGGRPPRWRIAATAEAHSSVRSATEIMDVGVLEVPGDARGALRGEALRGALDADPDGGEGLFAVVATAGSTNVGVVDDLAGAATVAGERGLWLHVDAAYGGAGLAAPTVRPLFDGIERADSVTIDPHKWLFSPFDCAALLYREPAVAAAAHTQEAAYLDAVTRDEWNPHDYAFHLSRRARGLPFWFSLVAHGSDAYRDAVEASLTLARRVAAEISGRGGLELVIEPELSIVLFRRLGWERADYDRWADDLLAEQRAFVRATSWQSEPVMRFCFVNPRTTVELVRPLLDSMLA
ncbi:MAG TPA: pyridoxal-dependent decarboxylase [Acidimicrobiales bacterium]|nr:pyridoxal-dependent decarboxylase [Acidimicrobiales bacterium]